MIWNLHDWGICWDEESQKARGRAVPSVPQLEVPCAAPLGCGVLTSLAQ